MIFCMLIRICWPHLFRDLRPPQFCHLALSFSNAAKAWKRGSPTPTVRRMCVLCMSLFRSDRVEPREKEGAWIGWFGLCWERRPACQKVWETKEWRTVAILEMHTKHKKEQGRTKACSLKLCAGQWIVKSRFFSNESAPPFCVASLFWELFWNAISIFIQAQPVTCNEVIPFLIWSFAVCDCGAHNLV